MLFLPRDGSRVKATSLLGCFFFIVGEYHVTGIKRLAIECGTGKCKYDLVWRRKEALDRLTHTNLPLAQVTLSFSFSCSLTFHPQILSELTLTDYILESMKNY